MRNLVILLDIHCLYTAETGIRKYVENFIDILGEEKNPRHKYVLYPSLQRVNRVGSYHKRKGFVFRIIYHFETFVWKQFIIPWKAWVVNADVIFSPDYYVPIWPTSANKVAVFHDTFFWDNPEHYGRNWLKYFKRICLLGLKWRGSVLTISRFSMSKVEEVVPKSINVDFQYHAFRGHSDSFLTGLEIIEKLKLEDKKVFLHVGVFEKRKNLQTLLRAFHRFLEKRNAKEYRLILVGNRPVNERLDDFNELINLINELGLQEFVLLPGYLSDFEIKVLLRKAIAYIFPSTNEGFGMPILEAFQMGCPIITSDQPALMEIGSQGTLIFPSHDHDRLYDLMIQVEEDIELRESLIRKGRERLKDFDRGLYFKNMENYFNSFRGEHDNLHEFIF